MSIVSKIGETKISFTMKEFRFLCVCVGKIPFYGRTYNNNAAKESSNFDHFVEI